MVRVAMTLEATEEAVTGATTVEAEVVVSVVVVLEV